ncbi:MAG: hypothetical protein AAFM91_19500 [Pseudomonadota bacterium]
MVLLESFIKVDGDLVPMAASGIPVPVPDPDYIEGALHFVADGVEVLPKYLHDYVDQLWAYLVDAADVVSHGDAFKTYMPGQAITLLFVPVEFAKLRIERREYKDVAVTVSRREFVSEIVRKGTEFFEDLAELVPELSAECQDQLLKIGRIRVPGSFH